MEQQLKGIKVAIIVANGFEQVEMEKPRQALEQEGAITYLISPEPRLVDGWNHMEKGDTFIVDIPLEEAKASDFDALLLPGGVHNPDKLRTYAKAVSFVKEINGQNKPIAAICHGPWLLINADIVKGHNITSWPSLKMDLVNAGGKWIDDAVVCDNNLITSRKPDDIPQFNKSLIRLIKSRMCD